MQPSEPTGPPLPNFNQEFNQPPSPSQPIEPMPPENKLPTGNGKKRKLMIVIIIVLALAGAAAYILINGDESDSKTQNTSETEETTEAEEQAYSIGFNYPETTPPRWNKDTSAEAAGTVKYTLEELPCTLTFEQVPVNRDVTPSAAAALDAKFQSYRAKTSMPDVWFGGSHSVKPWEMRASNDQMLKIPTNYTQYTGADNQPYALVMLLAWIEDTQISVTVECRGDYYFDEEQAIAQLLESVIIGVEKIE
jgi:hypothetical protein